MEGRKYILTDETKEVDGYILHRIQAVRDFSNVKAGDLGGWIEKEENLDHEGNCWVKDEACIYEDAKVYGDAKVHGDARVYGNAQIYGNAQVYGRAKIFGSAQVSDNASICGDAWVYEDARVHGNAQIGGNASAYNTAEIYEDAWISGSAQIHENARVYGSTKIIGNANIYGTAKICRSARIYGKASIWSGVIESTNQYLVVGPIGSRNDFTTFFFVDEKILVSCGCFKGVISDFLCAVFTEHGDSKYTTQYLAAVISAQMILNEVNT